MSAVEITCACGRQLRLSELAVGKAGRCPSCRSRLQLIAPGYRPERDRFDDRLVVESGPEYKGQHFLLAGPGPIEIGKLPGKHILLNSQQVSRSHCRLLRDDHGGWRIEDQKSTNGTWVNGDRVSATPLYDADQLTVGDYVLRFHGTATRPVATATAACAVGTALSEAGNDLLGDDLYGLAEGEAIELPPIPPPVADGRVPEPVSVPATGGPECPSCGRSLAPSARICVSCGINLQTGRAILTADEGKLDEIYARTESIVTWLSWLIPSGLYPIASEALGTRKPYVVYGLAVLTILTSVWFWVALAGDSPESYRVQNYMLWSGRIEMSAEELV